MADLAIDGQSRWDLGLFRLARLQGAGGARRP
jgi:hypothetical protein